MTALLDKFSEAIDLKAELLVKGINVVSPHPGNYKPRIEHLYRHDSGSSAGASIPQELRLFQDPRIAGGKPVIVNVRYNPDSDWELQPQSSGNEALLVGPTREVLAAYQVAPEYYDKERGGEATARVVQHMGCDLAGIVPRNYCSFFSNHSECIFCEIVDSYKSSREYPSASKALSVIKTSLAAALRSKSEIVNVVVTSGNMPLNDHLFDTYTQIGEYLRQMNSEISFSFASLMPPEDFSRIELLKKSGFTGVGFNLEAWDEAVLPIMAPGKNLYGRRRMLDALECAVECFGRGFVFSNLVYGIQSVCHPRLNSFDVDAERELSLKADSELLEKNIIPLHTIYHTMGANRIGPIPLQKEAVLDFHRAYALKVLSAAIVPESRDGVLFGLGSISNHLYNDVFVEARYMASMMAKGTGGN